NSNGILDAGEVSTTTSACGAFTFANLPAGAYRVADVIPAGWHATSAPGGVSVTLPSQGANAVSLGAAQDATGSISGFVFNDLTNNGTFNASDPGLAGWTLFIDANSNG